MRVKIGGDSLNIIESGAKNDSPSLVFLHYFGGAAISWRKTIELLGTNFHCVAVDLRGFGKSQDTASSYKLEDYTRDVVNLTEELKLENYLLIGHSMGGKIAFTVAAAQPENLRGLILIAPSPPAPEPMADDERQRLRNTHGTREAAIETIEKASFRKIAAEIFEEAVEANLESDEAAWKTWLDAESKRDVSDLSDKISVPLFVAVGERDENITAELVENEIIGCVERAALIVIKNAAHLLPLEAAEETTGFIRSSANKFEFNSLT